MSDKITHRFTELEYALTAALDEAVERRVQQLNKDSTLYSPPPATTEELVADLAFADVNPAAQLSAADDPAVSALAHLWLR